MNVIRESSRGAIKFKDLEAGQVFTHNPGSMCYMKIKMMDSYDQMDTMGRVVDLSNGRVLSTGLEADCFLVDATVRISEREVL